MKSAALHDVKNRFSEYLRKAESEDVIILRHGRPAGVLIGFEDDDDWIDYRIEHDPTFLNRIAAARAHMREGRGMPFEDVFGGRAPSPIRSARPRRSRRTKS